MFILYAVAVGVVAGILAGGHPAGLGRLQFRWGWIFFAGLLVQLVLFSYAVSAWIGSLGVPIYVASTLAVDLAIAANYRIPGMPVVLVGALSNLAAIVANGGYMPASTSALGALAHSAKSGYSNSAVVPNPQLPWLTDIFAMPGWLPFANVFSVGDVLIGVGVVIVMVAAMRSAPRRALRPSSNLPRRTT